MPQLARRLIIAGLLVLVAISPAVAKTTFISIGTGGTGGVYYPYGGGLAQIWSEHLDGVKVVAEVTGASVENVKLAHRGETVIGEVMGDVAYQAYEGQGRFHDAPQKILGLAVMYPNILQIVTRAGTQIDSLNQLAGKKVSIGAPGSGTAFMSDLVLGTLEIQSDSFKARRLSFVESANALKDHTIDVGIWCVAPPTSSIMDLATTHDIRIVPFSADEQRRVTARHTFYSVYNLPAGIYRGVDEPVPTISVWNVIICNAELPDDLVYRLTKALFEHQDYLQKIHPFARYTTPENALQHSPIPLHPGTVDYLIEIGLDVPARLQTGEHE